MKFTVDGTELVLSEMLNSTPVANMTHNPLNILLLAVYADQAVVVECETQTGSNSSAQPETDFNTGVNQDLERLEDMLKDFFVAQRLAFYAIGSVVGTLQIVDFLLKAPGIVRSIRGLWRSWKN